jgi:hypothetical protein
MPKASSTCARSNWGRDFGQRVEILSGVTAADKVIATPFDSLISGMTVRVAPSAKPQ